MATFVVAVGLVFGSILKADIAQYLPFLTVNIVIWNFLSQVLTESCAVFVQAEGYIRQERLPKTIFIMRLFIRNLLTLAHNAILIPIVFVIFGVSTTFAAILVLPGERGGAARRALFTLVATDAGARGPHGRLYRPLRGLRSGCGLRTF